eukprot:6609863-Pyramimonas_sp.AAC.1
MPIQMVELGSASGFWKCSVCARVSRLPTRGPPPPPSRCTPVRGLEPRASEARGHRCVTLECSDNAALVICTKCFSYSSHGRISGLAESCAAPTRSK